MNKLDVTKSHKQPVHKTLDDAYVRVTTESYVSGKWEVSLSISSNRLESIGLTIDVHMYDTLKAALEDYRVIEHMNTLRGK